MTVKNKFNFHPDLVVALLTHQSPAHAVDDIVAKKESAFKNWKHQIIIQAEDLERLHQLRYTVFHEDIEDIISDLRSQYPEEAKKADAILAEKKEREEAVHNLEARRRVFAD